MDAASFNDQDRLALLRRAVEYLEAEHGTRVGRNRPAREEPAETRDSLRRLLTVRPPAPLPTHVHGWIDTVLQNERDVAGTVHAHARYGHGVKAGFSPHRLPPCASLPPPSWDVPDGSSGHIGAERDVFSIPADAARRPAVALTRSAGNGLRRSSRAARQRCATSSRRTRASRRCPSRCVKSAIRRRSAA
jgi:hypothetical protein